MEASKQKKDEKKIMGANYIYDFYLSIGNLNDVYSQYINLILELVHKYGSEEEGLNKISTEEKAVVLKIVQNTRFYCSRTYIMYCSIVKSLELAKKTINKDIDNSIKNSFVNFKDEFMLDRGKLEDFVVNLNAFLVEDIIKKILEDSSDLVKEIYDNGPTE